MRAFAPDFVMVMLGAAACAMGLSNLPPAYLPYALLLLACFAAFAIGIGVGCLLHLRNHESQKSQHADGAGSIAAAPDRGCGDGKSDDA